MARPLYTEAKRIVNMDNSINYALAKPYLTIAIADGIMRSGLPQYWRGHVHTPLVLARPYTPKRQT